MATTPTPCASLSRRERVRAVARWVVAVPVVLLLLVVALVAFAVMLPLRWGYGRWLQARWERTFGAERRRILLIYSRSPHWQHYIERAWLPRLGAYAVVLDWSDRGLWPTRALAVRAFRHWRSDTEFNPMAIVFPEGGKVRTIRFWRAFRDFKHGKHVKLRAAEAELFAFAETLGPVPGAGE